MLPRSRTQLIATESRPVSTHVLAWGDDGSSQCLGGARSSLDAIVSNPAEVRLPATKRDFIQVGAGWEQSFLVTGTGTLWCGGSNRGKCLSEDEETEQLLGLRRLDLVEAEDFEAAAIAAGREHFVALKKGGSQMLTWGTTNEFGQTGQGEARIGLSACRPRQIPVQVGVSTRVCAVACGEDHTLALTEHGDVFAWGSNSSGQLGVEALPTGAAPDMLPAPQHIHAGALKGLPVRQVATGMQYSMALGISGQVISWGSNRHGRLGLGIDFEAVDKVLAPTFAEEPANKGVRSIAAGGHHSAVVMRKGKVFFAGDNRCGQLGRSPGEISSIGIFVEMPGTLCVRAAALGESHTLLLSRKGELFGFGANDRGQLGEPVGGIVDTPRQIMLPDANLCIWAVAAGPGHTVVLASGPPAALTRSSSNGESPPKAARTVSLPCGFSEAVDDDDEDALPLERTTAYHGSSLPESLPLEHNFMDVRRLGSGCQSKSATTGKVVVPCSPAHASAQASMPVADEDVVMAIVRPGVAAGVNFACLTVDDLRNLLQMVPDGLASAEDAGLTKFRASIKMALRYPTVLGASFNFPNMHKARLRFGEFGKQILEARRKLANLPKIEEDLLGDVVHGLKTLVPDQQRPGVVPELKTRDQVRCLVLYLLVPNWPLVLRAEDGVNVRSLAAAVELLQVISMLSTEGRAAFRDIVADECADVELMRDLLVLPAQAIANAAVLRTVEQTRVEPSLWQAVLLMQLLWISETCRLEVATANAQVVREGGQSPTTELLRSVSISSRTHSRLDPSNRTASFNFTTPPAASIALPRSCFQISALVQANFPPQLELKVFHEHAKLRVLDPTLLCTDKSWQVDADGQLPVQFRSFMANGNLVPTAFKQRVLQVENHMRQLEAQANAGPGMMPFGLIMAAPLVLEVNRESVLQDTARQLLDRPPEHLQRPLKVKFAGEEAVDEGGVAKEFFRLLGEQLFSVNEYAMFKCDSDSRYLWFDPVSPMDSPEDLNNICLAGQVLGLAVYNNLPGLDVNFPLALFKKLKDLPVTIEDLQMVFPSQAASLQAVLDWQPPTGTTVAEANQLFEDIFCLDFSVTCDDAFGSRHTKGILPSATEAPFPTVTFERRREFAEAFKEWYLTVGIQKQYESFKLGFRRVCGGSPVFDCLSAQELQAIVSGERDLDFSNLRKGAKVVDSEVPFRPGYVDELWEILNDFDAMQKQQFLKFVTGSNLAPVGGLERLELKIQRNGGEPIDQLPTSHTCFNLLTLPEYSDKEKLRKLLIYAIANAEGFGLE